MNGQEPEKPITAKHILFDPDFGPIQKNINDFIDEKRRELQSKGVIIDEKDANIFNIIAGTLASYYTVLQREFNELLTRMKPSDDTKSFYSQIQEYTAINCTTEWALIKGFRAIKGVQDANIVSDEGKFTAYLILDSDFVDTSKKVIKTDEANKAIAFKLIWEVFYELSAAGTKYEGDYTIEFPNKENQKKEYKFSLGKKKYVYIKMKYKITSKHQSTPNVDQRVRDIYSRIVKNNYGHMGVSFEWQDFVAPTNEIPHIKLTTIEAVAKDDDKTDIKRITDWSTANSDIEVQPSELLVFDLQRRLDITLD